MPAVKNLTGQRFGRLVAKHRVKGSRAIKAGWLCICDCGRTHTTATTYLTSGDTRSCGCLKHAPRPPRRKIELLTNDRLKELFHYNPDTGAFTTRSEAPQWGRTRNAQGGVIHESGYLMISIQRRLYRAHRLAWLYMNGVWPSGQIDHINGMRNDNRWSNLRDVPHWMNNQNQRQATSKSLSGLLGVSKKRKRWEAKIGVNGQTLHLGIFDTPVEAHEAYLSAKRKLHPGCTI
jgi:hypothetical protein